MYNKVEICGVNTARLKVLEEKEKQTLLERAAQGDREAREQLIAGNLRLVLSVIQRFTARADDPDDLFQVGCVGLIKAVDHFDVSQNVRFSTYAVPMIVGEVRRYLRDNNMIRVSRSVRDLAYKALWEKEKLSVALGYEPSVEQVCQALNEKFKKESVPRTVTPKELAHALDAVVDPVSLFEPVYSEGSDSIYLMDQICDDKNLADSWCESIALRQAAGELAQRERHILELRFFKGKTQMEVAAQIGISQAQVSRLEKSALERLRRRL